MVRRAARGRVTDWTMPLEDQVDDTLRLMRATNRAEQTVAKIMPFLPDRQQIVRNLKERMDIYADITKYRGVTDAWAMDYSSRTLDMILALSRGLR